MHALIAFRIKVENPLGWSWQDISGDITRLASDVAALTAALAASTQLVLEAVRRVDHMEIIEEGPSIQDESDEDKQDKGSNENVQVQKQVANNFKGRKPSPLQILDRVTMNNTFATPLSTIKGFLNISSRNAATSYMKMVDNSYLGSSEEVNKLMERVEVTFIKHFANSNRFFAGCTVALIVALSWIIRARNIMGQEGRILYMETMFPLYSLIGFVVLHMVMHAATVYFWRRYRVNYAFIFGFKQGTELGYREVLLVSFGLAVLALASVHSNLDMEMDPKTMDYKIFTEIITLILVALVFIILFLPFNILYRSSHFFFLTCLFHCICAPLYKVTLPDFFLADQFTSQVQAFRSLEFYICYYAWGDFRRRENSCKNNDCLRRLFEEKDPLQGYNGVKYFVTIVALCLRTAYSLNHGLGWQVLALIFSVTAAIIGTYWDLVYDWGLLQRHSKNRWLRDKLLIPKKSVYFGSMLFGLHRQTMITIVASLEIIRRGMWNFFRLENEHLNDVGRYRAFKSVPLPFNYDEDEDKEE
ncbi:hypothetical protein REPUB_Repub01dG0017800 [Reevesia pubescens]